MTLARRRRRSSTASAASSPSARRTTCWRSAPAGAALPFTPRALRLPGHHHHHIAGSSTTRPRACARRRPGRPHHLLREDYRDLKGTYDKLVSIEMIEAIGHQYFGTFFRRCAERLAPGGRCCSRRSPSPTTSYARARDDRSTSSSATSSPAAASRRSRSLVPAMAASTDLRVLDVEDIGPHYATTLARWRENFLAASRRRAHARLRRRVPPHVGVLLLLLRGRLRGARPRRRPDVAHAR